MSRTFVRWSQLQPAYWPWPVVHRHAGISATLCLCSQGMDTNVRRAAPWPRIAIAPQCSTPVARGTCGPAGRLSRSCGSRTLQQHIQQPRNSFPSGRLTTGLLARWCRYSYSASPKGGMWAGWQGSWACGSQQAQVTGLYFDRASTPSLSRPMLGTAVTGQCRYWQSCACTSIHVNAM